VRAGGFQRARVANNTPVLHRLVFSAHALPVGHRTEDAGAEQAIPLRLEGAVIDSFGLGYFTVRPAPDFFRRCQTDADGIEVGNRIYQVKGTRTIQGAPPVPAASTPPHAAPKTSGQCSVASNSLDPVTQER